MSQVPVYQCAQCGDTVTIRHPPECTAPDGRGGQCCCRRFDMIGEIDHEDQFEGRFPAAVAALLKGGGVTMPAERWGHLGMTAAAGKENEMISDPEQYYVCNRCAERYWGTPGVCMHQLEAQPPWRPVKSPCGSTSFSPDGTDAGAVKADKEREAKTPEAEGESRKINFKEFL